MKALLPSTNSTHHYPQLATPSASSTRSASVTLRCLVQPSMIELYIISSGVKCPSLFISCVCPTGNSGIHLRPRYIPRFLCLCFEDFIPHQAVFLKISQTHLDKKFHMFGNRKLWVANTLPFFLKFSSAVYHDKPSPQARWRPFPHHLWRRIWDVLGVSISSVWFICQFCLFGDNEKALSKSRSLSLLSRSKYLVNIQNDEFRYTKNALPSDPQIPKHQTIQMIRVLNPCMNGLKYLSSTSESHWNNKCTHHLHLFVTKLLHPGMISPNSTKSYGTLQLYDPVTCPPSRCWHNAKQVTGQAIALYDGGVGDDVRLNAGLSHIFQQHTGFLHAATFGTGIKHCVVSDGVAGDAIISHFLPKSSDGSSGSQWIISLEKIGDLRTEAFKRLGSSNTHIKLLVEPHLSAGLMLNWMVSLCILQSLHSSFMSWNFALNCFQQFQTTLNAPAL